MAESETPDPSADNSDAKKKVAENVGKADTPIEEDPSRATLHYGAEDDYEAGSMSPNQGAPIANFQPTESTEFSADADMFDESDETSSGRGSERENRDAGSRSQPEHLSSRAEADPLTLTEVQSGPPDGISVATTDVSDLPNMNAAPAAAFSDDTVPEDVNLAPEAIDLKGGTVAENAAGAVVGRLSVVDDGEAGEHTFEVSDDRFEVVDGELRLKPGVSLDHEEASVIQVEITATDAGGLSVTETFEITVADVNEGPEAVSLIGSEVSENADGEAVGKLSVVDPDRSDAHTFDVSDDRFQVVDGELRLKPGVSLDFEDEASVGVTVTATDSGGLSVTETFEVTVGDVNEAPTGLSLSGIAAPALSLNENGAKEDLALLENMAGFPTDALTIEMTFQSVDPAPTHGVSLFSYAADTGHNNEFLVWAQKGADGPLSVFIAGKKYNTRVDADDVLDGQQHSLAVTWDQATGDLRIFVDGVLADSRTVDARSLEADGSIALGQEQDTEGGRFDANQIFEGQISEVRLFDHVRTPQEIAENAGAPFPNPAGTDGLLINWIMDSAPGGVVVDHAGGNDLVLGGTAHLVNTGDSIEGLTIAENVDGAVVGRLSFDDPDAGDTHTFAVSDERFEIVHGELRVKPGMSLDFEDA
ncbi:MAG: calsyntenin family protein, partial [Pseudomonadota bacterium]